MNRSWGLPEPVRETLFYALMFVTITYGFELIPSAWIESLTADWMSGFFGLLGLTSSSGVVDGFAFLTLDGVRYVSVTIIRECSAIHVWGVLAGLVLPLKGGSWRRKAESMVFGVVLIFVMNMSRIFLTVYLSAFDVPPFTWFFTHPTVETYHYSISFIYGVIGIAILIVSISRWFLPELADTLVNIPDSFKLLFARE